MSSLKAPPLRITRVFDAPRSEVFQWWADAEKLRQWSGCKQCVHCEIQMDFRVGGGFRQTMRIAANGSVCDVVLTATYEEIVVPERISYILAMGPQTTRVLLEFQEEGSRTKVNLTQTGFTNSESCQIVSQGTNDSFDQLESLVARGTSGQFHAEKESI